MSAVLYDAPGPRSRRRTAIGSVIAGLAVLGVLALVVLQLADQGQFEMELWSPWIDPTDESFTAVWDLIAEAGINTLLAAALSMAFSLVIGTLLALSRITAARWYRWAIVGVIELLRGIPVVIAIFFAARVLPQFGVDLPTLWYLVIGLTAYNSVIIAEIVRAGINSLPTGQREAAQSIGLRRSQVLGYVLLPQAFRVMLPALISQLVVVLKDTSLGFIISYEETVNTAGIIIQNLRNPIQTYLIIALLFIVVNYALSKFAVYLERRLSRGKKGVSKKAEEAAMTETGAAGA
ncbi:amino acid ABC transporter permease [Prauserella muralis]|uniref:Polar amino acid ABC transporter permease n=1 Tax=Prauserella muralis TaxID=588067 RepID=A0A2V4AI22_9PSEU|nr:amino acid ABC transporter permease [Prauserella muralis]PXY19592.1 polar amino acid ABC transporter permease [Prauserella muralis]TWE29590.1 amino acid ABC transporter membrane protein 2 (PAAT family) [Prauserella muralis]